MACSERHVSHVEGLRFKRTTIGHSSRAITRVCVRACLRVSACVHACVWPAGQDALRQQLGFSTARRRARAGSPAVRDPWSGLGGVCLRARRGQQL